jgi:1-hydroxycarotenoid 3,4-desaturase
MNGGGVTGKIAVVGAGIGGLVAALELAVAGCQVVLLERQGAPGGKLRRQGPNIDAGPTVFTMRWVFDELCAGAGTSLDEIVTLRRARILARHAWPGGETLDLFADLNESADAIGRFAGAKEAAGFLAFAKRAKQIYATLEESFLRAPLPTPISLVKEAGLSGLPGLMRISPFDTMMKSLGKHFTDPRLKQLFGRYATYCGSSPYLAPATLMLVAHVEQDGVWLVEGGMFELVLALARLAESRGVILRCGVEVSRIEMRNGRVDGVTLSTGERIGADTVVVNADSAAVASGMFGREVAGAVSPLSAVERSQSAVTWTMQGQTTGFPLTRHNVFFSGDYRLEFDDVFRFWRVPREPTVYVCAQDRMENESIAGSERIFCLVNAPADGDRRIPRKEEVEEWGLRMMARLSASGLDILPDMEPTVTTPQEFERLFPGTGGALYGRSVHGSMATFKRPGSRTKIPGLYLAGGSAHPGAGVPMAALSGRLAAAAVMRDGASTAP